MCSHGVCKISGGLKENKMKVLYIYCMPAPYRVDFFNELGKYCDLTVLFERKTARNREQKWLASEFYNFRAIFLRGLMVGDESSFSPEVVFYINRGYDVIVTGGYSSPTYMIAMTYMRAKKIPFFLNADGGFIKEDSWWLGKLKHFLVTCPKGYLSTGSRTSQYLMHYGAKEENIYVFPFTSVKKEDIYSPGIEEKKAVKQKLGISAEKILISVGQFIPRKGFDLLIRAAKMINSEYGVYIIGGCAGEEYNTYIRNNHITNVHFVDFKVKSELQDYYIAADAFVFPTREDVWGLVLNEALAFGLPVVTSDKAVSSFELVQEGRNGYIVDPEAVEKMAGKITEILDHDELRQKMSEEALGIIEKYTIENMALRHMEIFNTWKDKL